MQAGKNNICKQLYAFYDNVFYKGADSQTLVILVNIFNVEVHSLNTLS